MHHHASRLPKQGTGRSFSSPLPKHSTRAELHCSSATKTVPAFDSKTRRHTKKYKGEGGTTSGCNSIPEDGIGHVTGAAQETCLRKSPRSPSRDGGLSLPEQSSVEALKEADKPQTTEGAMPKLLLLHHRMGYSVITLTESQRKEFNWENLEKYLLYKGQKYSSVNVLARFSILLLILYTFGILFLAFSVNSSSWLVVRFRTIHEGYSLFLVCRDQPLRLPVCTTRALSAHYESWIPHLQTCPLGRGALPKYAIVIFIISIFHFLCELMTLFQFFFIVGRPTRTRTLILTIFNLWFCVCAGVVNVVLFPYSVQCERDACRQNIRDSSECTSWYGWGYKLYCAVIGLNLFCALLAISMYSRIYFLGQRISTQPSEKPSCPPEERSAKKNLPELNGTRSVENGYEAVRDVVDPTKDRVTSKAEAPRARWSGGPVDVKYSSSHLANSPKRDTASHPDEPVDHLNPAVSASLQSLHPSNEVPQGRKLSSTWLRNAKNERVPSEVFRLNDDQQGYVDNGGRHVGSDRPNPKTVRSLADRQSDRLSSLEYSIHDREIVPGSALSLQSREVDRHYPKEQTLPEGIYPEPGKCLARDASKPRDDVSHELSQPRVRGNEFAEPHFFRKQRSTLSRFFGRDSNPEYITAAELGVHIKGANDWVYHDRSDMYYSFERNMFWDPLTHEYYNCAIKCWQETPDQIVPPRVLGKSGSAKAKK